MKHIIKIILFFITVSFFIGCFNDLESKNNYKISIQDETLETDEQQLFIMINNYRAAKNLLKFTWNSNIAKICRIHSQKMAAGESYISHNGFQERLYNINKSISFEEGAENIAFNSGFENHLQVAFDNWLLSPDHYLNIVGDFQFGSLCRIL